MDQATPASAEEQLQIFQRATRMHNMNSGKKTQVHQKVNYVFYWTDRNPGNVAKRVEIMGEFSNWKPILMKDIQDLDQADADELPSPTDGSSYTHYLRRDVDPKAQ